MNSTSSQGLQERQYSYTLIGDVRAPDAAGAESGQIQQLNNVLRISISEIAISFGAATPAKQLYLRFVSQQNNITPNDLNGARNQAFYFMPENVSTNAMRWQAANEYNGLVETTDQNLLQINQIRVVVHDAATDQPLAYAQCVIRFIFFTLGSRFAAQASMQQTNLKPSQVVGLWAQ